MTARRLARAPVDVLMVDRANYHTFQPLLYQVATAGLDASRATRLLERCRAAFEAPRWPADLIAEIARAEA